MLLVWKLGPDYVPSLSPSITHRYILIHMRNFVSAEHGEYIHHLVSLTVM